jgi:hypothetical protein
MSEPGHTEVLKHLKTLIRVASEADDIATVHRLLGEMQRIVEKALPDGRKKKPQ